MPDPTLRDRLAKIAYEAERGLGVFYGVLWEAANDSDRRRAYRIIDALLASEEWSAREAVIEAYRRCEESRGVFSCVYPHDNRCPKARADTPAQGPGEWRCECGREELDAALARLAAVKGMSASSSPSAPTPRRRGSRSARHG